MKKIKESFTEVVAGDPQKEHYINVSLFIASVSALVFLCLMALK